jgi:hypothetical protein
MNRSQERRIAAIPGLYTSKFDKCTNETLLIGIQELDNNLT